MWAIIGAVVSPINAGPAGWIALIAYSCFYGAVESLTLPGVSAPGSRWQVPSAWVHGVSKRRRAIVWGALLGPGVATRNPYAGYMLLPIALVAINDARLVILLAISLGTLHALGRVLGLLRQVAVIGEVDPLEMLLRRMYWRKADGLALTVIAGFVLMSALRSTL